MHTELGDVLYPNRVTGPYRAHLHQRHAVLRAPVPVSFPGVNGDVGGGDGANHGDAQDELQGKSVHETNGETTRKETDARYRTEYHRKQEPRALQGIIDTN